MSSMYVCCDKIWNDQSKNDEEDRRSLFYSIFDDTSAVSFEDNLCVFWLFDRTDRCYCCCCCCCCCCLSSLLLRTKYLTLTPIFVKVSMLRVDRSSDAARFDASMLSSMPRFDAAFRSDYRYFDSDVSSAMK